MHPFHLIKICTLPICRRAIAGFVQVPRRHVSSTLPFKKYSKETVAAIIQMHKENLELFGKRLKKSSKTEKEKARDDGSKESEDIALTKKCGRSKKVKEGDTSENDVVETSKAETKRRGRPKKIKTETLSEVELQESDLQPRKRGWPKKTKTKTEQEDEEEGSPAAASETKKRGRPKKVKSESEFQKQGCVSDDSNSVKKVKATTVNSPGRIEHKSSGKENDLLQNKGNGVFYATDPSESNILTPDTNDLSSLSALLTFPFFHPSRKEYYVSVPTVPHIYIPGYSERATSENPFFPSVGTILGATQPPESRMMLKRWRDNLVKELGEAGFQKYQKELFARGSNFHQIIEQYLKGEEKDKLSIEEDNAGYWQSAYSVLKDITDVQAVEEVILHKHLCYKGQFDCIASYRDRRMLIDWKTSKKPKATIQATYDNPLQVAAYIGAYNYIETNQMVDNAMIVVCYEDGQPAHTHVMTRAMCIDYWADWLKRLHTYWIDKFSARRAN